MAFAIPQTTYTGKIKEVVLGKGPGRLRWGKHLILLMFFEGECPIPLASPSGVRYPAPTDWSEGLWNPTGMFSVIQSPGPGRRRRPMAPI